MIDREYDGYILICDNCGHEANETIDTFQDAVDAKKELGWISKKDSKGWHDLCPDCQK